MYCAGHNVYDCIPCLVNQTFRTIELTGCKDPDAVFHSVFDYMKDKDFHVTAPEISGDVFGIITKIIGDPDPYRELKLHYDRMLMERFDELYQEADSILDAVRFAIAGNIIDFSPAGGDVSKSLGDVFEQVRHTPFAIDDSEGFLKDLSEAKTILYLLDNCGEIVLDKLLIKKIKEVYPDVKVTAVVHGAPAMNDCLMEDAEVVGLSEVCDVIDSGDYIQAIDVRRGSAELNRLFDEVDLVISKGQGNFECNGALNKKAYFLLMAKCEVLSRILKVPQRSLILKRSDAYTE